MAVSQLKTKFHTMRSILLLLVLPSFFATVESQSHIIRNSEVRAAKGKFMVHMLHSAYFFPQTVDVKWSASTQGKPDLPLWLHLFHSRHKAIAYLVGTPVTPLHQVTIHVIARRTDTYQTAEQFLTFLLTEDARYNTSTQQVAEIYIKNVEAEEFMNPRSDRVKQLERSIHETFRGRYVNPYIFNIIPEVTGDADTFYAFSRSFKAGTTVQVGTQKKFHTNVENLMAGLRKNPHYCKNNKVIPLDKQFSGAFNVDWCRFAVKNVTLLKQLVEQDLVSSRERPAIKANFFLPEKTAIPKNQKEEIVDYDGGHFWESVLIFPVLAVACILLVLALSFIFFGRREGQHWRDYKTPKEQLHEYLQVRESQRHLREMSVQRQMLLMNKDRQSATPLGISSFLQPKETELGRSQSRGMAGGSQPRLGGTSSLSPTLERDGRRARSAAGRDGDTPSLNPRASVGKQTVAEAAKATGSSLHLYRNPYDDDEHSDEEPEQHQPNRKITP